MCDIGLNLVQTVLRWAKCPSKPRMAKSAFQTESTVAEVAIQVPADPDRSLMAPSSGTQKAMCWYTLRKGLASSENQI